MPKFFKSQDYHLARSHLQDTGFYNSDFTNFRVIAIANKIIDDPSIFAPLTEVLKDIKLTPLRVLKIQILVQHLLQVDVQMQENQFLFDLLSKVNLKIQKMISSKNSLNPQLIKGPEKDSMSSNIILNAVQPACQNETTMLLRKILGPLVELQKRLVFSYQLVCSQSGTSELQISSCWAVLNLLKKFVELSPHIQAIGRYYPKYIPPMILLIKVLNVDIQLLYTRIKSFICTKISAYQVLHQQGLLQRIKKEQRIRIKELLELIEQVEGVNELVLFFYRSHSFKSNLVLNNIHMPSLFDSDTHLDLLYHFKKIVSGNIHSNSLFVSPRKTNRRAKYVQDV